MDWLNDLNDFLHEKGIKKQSVTHEENHNKLTQNFTSDETETIIRFNQTVLLSAFKTIAKEINSYINLSAEIARSPKEYALDIEGIELQIKRIMQLKFVYKPRFFKSGQHILFEGFYSITNLYGNPTGFKSTGLQCELHEVTETQILDNLMKSFRENADLS